MKLTQPFLPLRKEQTFLPLEKGVVSAGFPSPAEDYLDTGIDLNEQLIRHPTSTFLLRISGDSMSNAGIHNGDLLIVDRSLEPKPGRIVVAILDGAFTLKRLVRYKNELRLEAENPQYPPIEFCYYDNIEIWGVATYSIHNINTGRQV